MSDQARWIVGRGPLQQLLTDDIIQSKSCQECKKNFEMSLDVCVCVCVGIVYDATVSMRTPMLGWVHRWVFELAQHQVQYRWDPHAGICDSPELKVSFLSVPCAITHLLKPGRFYLKTLGQKAFHEVGCWQPLPCVPECARACFGVGQHDFGRYDGWVRVGSHGIRKVRWKRRLQKADKL